VEQRFTGMKTTQRLCTLATVCAGIILAPLAATAQTSPGGDRTTTARADDRDNDHDYGWIGLAGLLGLAGLMRKKHDHDRVDVTTRR
jgi:hypothetical protein